METVGTDTGLILVSVLIQLAVLGGLGYGLYRLIRASRNKPILLAGLIIIALLLVIAAVISYAYLGALGRGMSL